MSYAAATDSAMVKDVSYSIQKGPGIYGKGGGSLVIDFSDNGGIYSYGHGGGGYGYSSGLSYSVGLVQNLNEPNDYAGSFYDLNAGKGMGIDHCFSPESSYDKATKATSLSFGLGFGYSAGYDYYTAPHIFKKWGVYDK